MSHPLLIARHLACYFLLATYPNLLLLLARQEVTIIILLKCKTDAPLIKITTNEGLMSLCLQHLDSWYCLGLLLWRFPYLLELF